MKINGYMVFDVESVGLHGEGFAYGYVAIGACDGLASGGGWGACDPNRAIGHKDDRIWVGQNIPLLRYDFQSPFELRRAFWGEWMHWKKEGYVLAADCPWPVESKFLIACIYDDPSRAGDGPYPLIDVASVVLAHGGDPTGTFDRVPNEMPPHNPLNDARQSARILARYLKLGEEKPVVFERYVTEADGTMRVDHPPFKT